MFTVRCTGVASLLPFSSTTIVRRTIVTSSVVHVQKGSNTRQHENSTQRRVIPANHEKVPKDFFTSHKYTPDELNEPEKTSLVTTNQLSDTQGSATAIKKAKKRRVKLEREGESHHPPAIPSIYECRAFCTAESYNIPKLRTILGREYTIESLPMEVDTKDVLCVSVPPNACDRINDEESNLAERACVFFFRHGSTVSWNVNKTELDKIHVLLSRAHNLALRVATEEFVAYGYANKRTRVRGSDIVFSEQSDPTTHLHEKFAISDALALSVKLDVWEDIQDVNMESMRSISRAMKLGKGLIVGMKTMLQKTGELQSLRHDINLSSSLRSPSDVYWDRPGMETLFLRMCAILDIRDRTTVLNEKLTYSNDLAEILRGYVAQKHTLHTELAIIGLITVEVVFEVLHWLDRFGYLVGK
eukprot:CFRG8629T1